MGLSILQSLELSSSDVLTNLYSSMPKHFMIFYIWSLYMEILQFNIRHVQSQETIDTLEDTYETYVSSLNDFNNVLADTPIIEEDAQDEHLAHNKKLEEQEYSKVLYDNIFKSQKDIGDDNLEYDPMS